MTKRQLTALAEFFADPTAAILKVFGVVYQRPDAGRQTEVF
ncbi:hypothetical protein [Ponticoccus alexandrii]|nr:hypothetical protein [Ponticoccus alexandrii]